MSDTIRVFVPAQWKSTEHVEPEGERIRRPHDCERCGRHIVDDA